MTGKQQVLPKQAIDPNEVSAWREGKLIFTNRPLHQVIDEINRYRPVPLFLLNQRAAVRPVSGVFDIDRLDENLLVIAEQLALTPIQVNGTIVAMY